MLPNVSQSQLETLRDAALVWACWESTALQLRGRSMAVKRAVYAELSPTRRALYMVEAVRGHSNHGVLHLLGVLTFVLEDPKSWPALRNGFAFFGAERMVQLMAPIEALHQRLQESNESDPEVVAAAQEIDRSLTASLAEALRLVAAYIRSHPTEFVQLEA